MTWPKLTKLRFGVKMFSGLELRWWGGGGDGDPIKAVTGSEKTRSIGAE